MDDNLKKFRGTFFELFIVIISAVFLSVISAINSANDLLYSTVYFLIFSIFFLFLFLITIGTLSVINSSVKSKYGKGYIYGSVVHGFMLLFPFAVMLFFSDVLMKWNAFQTITATSIVTSVTYSTSDLIKLGGSRAGNMIISLVFGILFMVLFILIVSFKNIS